MLDSHHHLWSYSAKEYPWIPAGTPLAQDQLLPQLHTVTTDAGIDGTVVVQARQIIRESDWLLSLADESTVIKAVVGWVPLIDKDVRKDLDRLASHPKFRAVRHVLQEEPDDYFLRDDFHRGLALLSGFDLRYELLLFQRQLPVAMKLVDRQPKLGIIIDHIAKPEAKNGRIDSAWKRDMQELAKRDNILGVKFSGLVTEFPEGDIDPHTISAYFEESLRIFGPDKLMFGTDWPVCLLRIDSYQAWADTVRDLLAPLTPHEQTSIATTNCRRAYGF
jgi:L-fuconolactonase